MVEREEIGGLRRRMEETSVMGVMLVERRD